MDNAYIIRKEKTFEYGGTYRSLLILFASLFYAGAQIFSGEKWGKYFLLACTVGMLITYLSKNKLTVNFNAYIIWCAVMVAFGFLCTFWAISYDAAMEKAVTVFLVCLFCAIIYLIFVKHNDIDGIVKAIIFGGIILSLYLVYYYGLTAITNMAAVGERFASKDVGNSNAIGFYMSYTIIAIAYEILFKRIRFYHLAIALCLTMLITSESRTALIGMLVGIIVLLFFKAKYSHNLLAFSGFFFALMTVIILIAFVRELAIFKSFNDRIDDLIITLKGGTGDSSSKIRMEMVKLGLRKFKEAPILGIGFGNTKYILRQAGFRHSYLHNNYVEMLVSGGVVGFAVWYFPYVFCAVKYIKYIRLEDNIYMPLAMAVLCTILTNDIGTVSYYNKCVSFLIMFLFAVLTCMNKSSKEKKGV